MSVVLVKYILLAAFRDKLIWGVLAISIFGACLSMLSGSAAVMEQGQFVLTYMAGGLRIISLLGLTLFTVFFVRRSFDSRDIEFLLTRPLSRTAFVFSHTAAFSILAMGAGIFVSIIVGGVASHYGTISSVMLWCFGVTFEFMITVNIAFFFAMVLSSPVSAGLATFGFYILSRLMGELLGILHHPHAPDNILEVAAQKLGGVVSAISVVIPRFDLLAQTSWLIYGGGAMHDWIFAVVQGAAFLSLISIATLIDLRRRQF
jgi:ABC-type transport system involved in multi-copper enzyme maturation permease subunit